MRNGFTLIELMIVVAIIAILAMAAVPLYTQYIDEAARTEARTNLADMASKEEIHFRNWDRYISTKEVTAIDAAVRSPQVAEAGDKAWEALGYHNETADHGGLFAGPVYFRYRAITDTTDTNYIVCGIRNLSGGGSEAMALRNANRRAVIMGSDCPAFVAAGSGGGGSH